MYFNSKMSNLCSNEIRELVHGPNKIDCDVVAIVDFQMKFHYNTLAFGISKQYFYKTLLPFVNTWLI